MRELADHLLRGGRGFYLFRAGIGAPIGLDAVGQVARSIATAEEEPGRVARIMAVDLVQAGWTKEAIARGLVEALSMTIAPPSR